MSNIIHPSASKYANRVYSLSTRVNYSPNMIPVHLISLYFTL